MTPGVAVIDTRWSVPAGISGRLPEMLRFRSLERMSIQMSCIFMRYELHIDSSPGQMSHKLCISKSYLLRMLMRSTL